MFRPSRGLAADLVSHVQDEPGSWTSESPVDEQQLKALLSGSGVAPDSHALNVSYMHRCWFHGHFVPHLVVRSARGSFTIIVLSHEHVSAPMPFEQSGLIGTIVPMQHGAVAVLAHGSADVSTAVEAVKAALR